MHRLRTYSKVCTHVSPKLQILTAWFTEIPRSESDVQMYLLLTTQTCSENLDLELLKIQVGVSQLAREWSINLTHRAEHEKWLQHSYAKDEWTQGHWDSLQRRSRMAIRLRELNCIRRSAHGDVSHFVPLALQPRTGIEVAGHRRFRKPKSRTTS
jgi:hypothetical protein